MDTESIKNVIDELIGPVEPVGSESIDEDRLKNLKKYGDLLQYMYNDLEYIRNKYINSSYSSEEAIGKEADMIMRKLSNYYTPPITLNEWKEDLIWCPSQCYYYFIDKSTGTKYCIYLRWRHCDPWTAELVECDENWEFNTTNDWETLNIEYYSDLEYKKLEEEALDIVKSKFPDSIP